MFYLALELVTGGRRLGQKDTRFLSFTLFFSSLSLLVSRKKKKEKNIGVKRKVMEEQVKIDKAFFFKTGDPRGTWHVGH